MDDDEDEEMLASDIPSNEDLKKGLKLMMYSEIYDKYRNAMWVKLYKKFYCKKRCRFRLQCITSGDRDCLWLEDLVDAVVKKKGL